MPVSILQGGGEWNWILWNLRLISPLVLLLLHGLAHGLKRHVMNCASMQLEQTYWGMTAQSKAEEKVWRFIVAWSPPRNKWLESHLWETLSKLKQRPNAPKCTAVSRQDGAFCKLWVPKQIRFGLREFHPFHSRAFVSGGPRIEADELIRFRLLCGCSIATYGATRAHPNVGECGKPSSFIGELWSAVALWIHFTQSAHKLPNPHPRTHPNEP